MAFDGRKFVERHTLYDGRTHAAVVRCHNNNNIYFDIHYRRTIFYMGAYDDSNIIINDNIMVCTRPMRRRYLPPRL